MPLLPQYKSDMNANEEENVPLWLNHENNSDAQDHKHDDEESLPGYPPQSPNHNVASGSGTTVHNTSYILVEGGRDKEEALSVLGRNREETIAIAQRGFIQLASIPPERIELLFPIERESEDGSGKRIKWVKILDEAWPQFENTPPKSIKVKVTETPEEKAKRERTEAILGSIIISIFIGLFIWFVVFLVHSSNKSKHK